MIRIKNIASYIPEGCEYNAAKKALFEIDDDFIVNKIGVECVSRKLVDEDTSDMCVKAFRTLEKKVPLSINEIDCIVVCTQNPDGCGIPHTSAVVHGKLDAPEDCATFDISLGCSGYIYSLSIVKSFMESNGFKNGLLFTADPYSKILDAEDKNTILLFGDAATVTLLGLKEEGKPEWSPVNFSFSSRGKDWESLHNNSGKLQMNGRAVFNFSATAVPIQINKLLESAKRTVDEIDLFVFHQGSKYIIDTLQKRLNLPPEKVARSLSTQGNTVSSSIPIILENSLQRPDINRILLSGFGVGLSWASCILEKQK